ncbi:hypothetical protein CUMW_267480, partial [Citrus unshiu]
RHSTTPHSEHQLSLEKKEKKEKRQLVIGLDCEGVDNYRHGSLLAFPEAIYLVDAIQGREIIGKACKPTLKSSYITKVIHDCKRDSEVSY